MPLTKQKAADVVHGLLQGLEDGSVIPNDVFKLHGVWKVYFNRQVLKDTWLEKGPALACLDLLNRGLGTVTEDRRVIWDAEKLT